METAQCARQGRRSLPGIEACLALAVTLAAAGGSLCHASSGGPRNPRFEHLSIEQGLSQAFVTSIVQDRRGFLWFGTQTGLNRYDGYTFVHYSEDPDDPAALSNNLVKDILESEDGDLWIATEGGGVDRLLRGSRGFRHYRHDPGDPTSLSSDRARTLLETADGRVWVGTDDGGLDFVERGRDSFSHVALPAADEGRRPAVRALAQTRPDHLWVGTAGGGLIELDTRSLQVIAVHRAAEGDPTALAGDTVCSLLADDDGTLWVGTCGGGLSVRTAGSLVFESYRADEDDPASLSSNDVWSLHQDQDGVLWVGTDLGLCEWRPSSQSFYRYRHSPSDPRSLAHNRVGAIYQDAGGVLWLGTYDGLNYWRTASMEFRHHAREDRPGGLTANMVTSFAEAPDGDIWVGTYGGGLNRLDVVTGSFTSLRHEDGRPDSLSDDRVMSLHSAPDGTLWVGTLAGGLDRLAPGASRFVHYRHDPGNPASLSTNGVTSILQDGRSLWVGTYKGGLNRLDLVTGEIVHFRHHPADDGTISSDQVLALTVGRQGYLLVASEGGIDRVDRATGAVARIPVRSGKDAGAGAGLHVFAVAESDDGDLWLGTLGSGVLRWRASDRLTGRFRFESYGTDEGLASEVAYGLLFDAAGDLWVSSNRGLSRLDPLTGEARRYDSSHGLQSDEFNFPAQLRASSDRLYFGGINGFSEFDPALVRDNTHIPPVVITGIYRNNEPLSSELPVTDLELLELDHRDYVVTIEFAALDFAAPQKNRYRYRLEGLERDWIEAGSLRRATYTTLRSGLYTFRVQAANNDGYWNEQGAQLRMTIAPAPWRTRTAYAGYSLALAALVGVYARGQARKRQRAAELASTNETLKREIDQRREKERALEREKEKARKYLDVAEVIMLALDAEERVTLVNQRGCRTLGLPEQDILGRSWCEAFLHPDDREASRRHFESPSRGTFEAAIVTRAGERRIVVWESTSLPADDTDAPGGALFSGADITEMRWLAEAKEAAESASLAKSQFLANISLEIRTPMGGVLGMIELLQGTELSAVQRGHVESARKSAHHLLEILNDILDFSKIEAGRLELEPVRFEIEELVRDVTDLFADSARAKALTLEHRIAPDVPPLLFGDTKRLRQVAANLLGNAVKFTERGGVELRVSRIQRGDQQTWIRFEVEDTGIGIDPARAEHVFEAFRQADGSTTRRFGGTGLGLAIARQLVEVMGGEIGFDSTPDGGSTFWFVAPLALPLGEDQAGGGADRVRRADTCLIVLPDAGESTRVRRLLEHWGIEAVTATGGADGIIDLLSSRRAERAPIDFALVDEDLRLEDGSSLLDTLLGHLELSDLRTIGVVDDPAAVPAVDAIHRPIRPSELFDVLYGKALPERADQEEGPSPGALAGLRFLVAEDNAVMQQVVMHHVREAGGLVERVDNGADAVSRCLEGSYDVVLMDCQMPIMDGYAATRAIRAAEASSTRPRTLIIAMTAHAMAGDRERCLAVGMDDYIAKPLSRNALLALVQRARQSPPKLPPTTAVAQIPVILETPPARSGAVDRSTLESLARSIDRGRGLVDQLIGIYLETSPEHVGALRSAAEAGDLDAISNHTHTLRSSSVTVGAVRLGELCRLAERAARVGDHVRSGELVQELCDEYARVVAELQAEAPGVSP